MADNKENKTEGGDKKPKNMKGLLLGAFAVLNLAVTGGGGYLVYASTLGFELPAITEADLDAELEEKSRTPASDHKTEGEVNQAKEGAGILPEPLLIYTMDKFTVNLSGFPRRTIRVEVNLEMLESDGYVEVMGPDNRAKARDRIVRILNDKTFDELETIQGKLFLKDRIVTELNRILDQGVVKDIYFSEFVVQ